MDVARLERVDHHDRQVRAELGQELPARTARRHAPTAADRDGSTLFLAVRDGRARGHTLCSDRQPERRILYVHALIDAAARRSQSRTDREIRIGAERALLSVERRLNQFLFVLNVHGAVLTADITDITDGRG